VVAVARPIPDALPVIMETLPARDDILFPVQIRCGCWKGKIEKDAIGYYLFGPSY
jgi:hypothetical protein